MLLNMREDEFLYKLKFFRNFFLVIIVLIVSVMTVMVLEGLLSLFENQQVREATPNQYAFYRFDSQLGWNNEANSEGIYKRWEFEYAVKINAYGMRYRNFAKDRNPAIYRVAVLGDSYTWGIGVADAERFTEKVEDLANHKIEMLNFGVAGYGPIQYYLRLDEIIEYKPDMVLIAFCLGNDFADNVLWRRYGYPKPYAERNSNGTLAIKGYPLPNVGNFGFHQFRNSAVLDWLETHSAIGRRILLLVNNYEKSKNLKQQGLVNFASSQKDIYDENANASSTVREAVLINEMILAKIKERLDAAGIKLVVMEVPTKFEVGLEAGLLAEKKANLRAHNALMSSLEKFSINKIELIDDITAADFWRTDGHWRPSGHEKAAQKIYDSLKGQQEVIGFLMR
jgi:lysophospholipase L1-like esterase